jgi:hypothetical protein
MSNIGLRAQPREDAGLSPAAAVFGAQIVLPNEFLQNDEFSVDTIVKIFSKTLHVSAPSLPRHNSSNDLPSKLPAELLSAPLVWVRRGSLVPPLQLLYNGSPRCHCRLLGSRPCSLAATKLVLFSDPLISSPSPSSTPRDNGPGTGFLPSKEVFARPGPAAPSQPSQTRYPSRQWALPKRLDLWPLLLPAEARTYFHRFDFNDNCRAKTFNMLSFPMLQVYDTFVLYY